MKLNLLSVAVLTSSLICTYAHANAATLFFEIQGIKNDAGKIYLSLFKGEENYQQDKAEAWQIVKPEKGNKVVVFSNLEPGDYAIKYFHDENDNRQLETNLFGSPIEGYGFSSDAKPNYGPAKYADMKILISAEQDQVKNASTVIYN